jgi:zona occludens toxin
MIRLYSGTPGSGKSLHNARDVINRSRMGKPVIGNFPADLGRFKKANYTYVPNYELNPDFLINYSRKFFQGKKIKEGAILLVIDECQLLFNSRDWQQKGRNEWHSFFSQHRKYGYDVTLIAQFDRMIDRQIRGLIEYEFIHRKLSNYGFGGKIMSLLFGGNTFVSVEMWYPLKLKISSDFIHARKYYYSIYDTFGTFQTEAPVDVPASDASPEAVSLPEVQNQEQTALALPDQRQLKLALYAHGKQLMRKLREPVRTVRLGRWIIYSGSGRHLSKFPDGRNELGWKL